MSGSSFELFYSKIKKDKPNINITAAGPAKREVLRTARRIQDEDLAELTFVGDTAWVFKTAEHEDVDMVKVRMIHETDLRFPAAALTIKRGAERETDIVINGYVTSEYMLQAAFDPTLNFIKGGALSELTAVELPDASKFVFITDTGIHAHPSIEERGYILENSLSFMKRLGIEKIKVAFLEETGLLKDTLEDEGKIKAEEAEKIALTERIREKHPEVLLSYPKTLEQSIGEGIPDLFLCSGAEAGQVLTQALLALVGGHTGRIILGGAVPMVLTANNPTDEHIWRSLLLAMAGK